MKKVIRGIKDKVHHAIKKINGFDYKHYNYIDLAKRTYKKIMREVKGFDFRLYLKTNRLFFTTVIGLLVNGMLLRFLTVSNYFSIKPIVGDLIILLIIGSFGYFFKPRKQFIYFLVVSIFFTAICVINSIYYTYYSSYASFSLFLTALQVVHVGDAVAENVFELKDLIYIWQPITLCILQGILLKNGYYPYVEKIERRGVRFRGTIIVSVFTAALFIFSLTSLEIGRLVKQWDREFLVAKYGIFIYQFNDIVKSIEPSINSVFGYDNAAKKIRDFYSTTKETSTNEYTNLLKGKNILMIHAESIQKFTMDLSFNGQEVTPNLNKLAKDGMFFSNFYSQVSVGTSSDTEFTLLTSLLPVSNGTVFVTYFDRNYVSIPLLLKEQNYYTFSMHGNNGEFWNRNVMHKRLGYDKYYSKTSYTIDETIGLGLSDKSFFSQSVSKIKTISEENSRFFGTVIMLSNHTPFDDVDKYGDFPVTMNYQNPISGETTEAPYLEGTTLGNYIKSVHYADSAIGEFIEGLNQEGLLENTVVIIYGDHDARLSKTEYNRLYNYVPEEDAELNKTDPRYIPIDYYSYELNRKVPFIIWTKDKSLKRKVTEVMGMYDVLPTLGNMFGFSSPYSLGHDIFSTNENIVVFPNGNWLTDKVYYNNQKGEYKQLNDEPLTMDYIIHNSTYADQVISVADDFIKYDFIKREQERTLPEIEVSE